jgi:diketogulonate reductase-like aldo/keto reductase
MRTVPMQGGKAMPVMGLGTWRMGDKASARATEIRVVQHAIERGITLFDTAEIYANGGAERVLGEAIAGKRDELFLVSKVAPSHASRTGTVEACEASLNRLRTDYLDLYLLHWIGSVPVEQTVQAFEQLREEGKIRAWGVSNFGLAEMKKLPTGCAANQVLYNPQARGIEFDLLPWCQQAGIPIMAYTPLGQSGGVLRNRAIASVAARHRATEAQIALAWGIRHPGVVTIPKTATLSRVDENLGALDITLTGDDLAEIDAAFPPPRRAQTLQTI